MSKRKVLLAASSQKVRDIKLRHSERLALLIGKLRKFLRNGSFIPGDKFTANLAPQSIVDGSVLKAILTGPSFSAGDGIRPIIEVELPLDLAGFSAQPA